MSLAVSFVLIASFVMTYAAKRRLGRRLYVFLLVLLGAHIVVSDVIASPGWIDATIGAVAVVAGCVALANGLVFARDWNRRVRAVAPLELHVPFHGTWRVAAGGALPGFNHHVGARDQYFAYDFIRRDATTLGSEIFAPAAGDVVAAHDGEADRRPTRDPDRGLVRGRELGNYVAIDTSRGVVFLCHLQNGSVCVRAGDRVEVGTKVGACGNSGRTTAPHLHLHAQDAPDYRFDEAEGLPVVFDDGTSVRVLQMWSRLRSSRRSVREG